MKDGVGRNEYRLNTATMKAIMQKHLDYGTEHKVVDFRQTTDGGVLVYVVTVDSEEVTSEQAKKAS